MTSIGQNIRHATGYLVAAMKMTEVFAVDAKLQKALEKYKTYLYRKVYFYLNQCDDRSLAKDSILNAISSTLGEKQASLVKDIVYPLMSLCLEYDARARKYRDKRLSSRLKRLVNFQPRKKIRATDESVTEIKVSVIIPVYNAEHHLRQALDSLCAQTLKDAEFICIDDGSSDGSGAILDEYATRDSRFRVFHRINCGVAETRNFGLTQARGEYLSFMDADDYVESVWLEDVYKISRDNELDCCFFDFQMFSEKTGEKLELWWSWKKHLKEDMINKVISPADLKMWWISGSVWSAFFKRSFVKKYSITFPDVSPFDDICFILSSMLKAKKIYISSGLYYWYRRSEDSLIMTDGMDGEAQIKYLIHGAKSFVHNSKIFNRRVKKICMKRFFCDVLYLGENNPKTLDWLNQEGWNLLKASKLSRRKLGKDLWGKYKKLSLRKGV
jgi:glycosyltransferase involved in cell wall biosynthesis